MFLPVTEKAEMFLRNMVRHQASTPSSQEIPPMLPKMFHYYVGNPYYFAFLRRFEESFPALKYLNNAYYTAPLSKWGLTIVPLMGIINGTTPAEKVDVSTSSSIAATGLVWGVYATMIQPQNWGTFSFFAAQMCCFAVNTYNIYRHWNYLQQQQQQQPVSADCGSPASSSTVASN